MNSLRSREFSRSVLSAPPESIKEMTSLLASSEEPAMYDSVSLFQYVTEELILKEVPGFKVYGQSCNQPFTICGRGRTFIVRRWPTGSGRELSEHKHFRPSQALKSLRSSLEDSPEEVSLRYRSLIQELRILLHKPLATHPNLLRIMDLSWELDPAGTFLVMPNIKTEFAAYGTLQAFLDSYDITYGMKRRIILDVAKGLSAIHKCCITHGDVKLDNILICQSNHPVVPVIAKLSDFGFSMDTSDGGSRYLVGRTPIWSAPEATERLSAQSLHLTDVYSFGFVIWSTAIDGRNPFYELEHLPHDFERRMEAFDFLKVTNELYSEAISQVRSTELAPYMVEEISELIEWSLQLDPLGRNLECILARLRSRGQSEEDSESLSQVEPSPLKPFNPEKVRKPLVSRHIELADSSR
jgi:serine/threonine protein kinase